MTDNCVNITAQEAALKKAGGEMKALRYKTLVTAGFALASIVFASLSLVADILAPGSGSVLFTIGNHAEASQAAHHAAGQNYLISDVKNLADEFATSLDSKADEVLAPVLSAVAAEAVSQPVKNLLAAEAEQKGLVSRDAKTFLQSYGAIRTRHFQTWKRISKVFSLNGLKASKQK